MQSQLLDCPSEIQALIFSALHPRQTIRCFLICKQLYGLLSSDAVWNPLCLKYKINLRVKSESESYYGLFIRRLAGLFLQPKIQEEQVTRQFNYVAVPSFPAKILVGYHRSREWERDLTDQHLQDRFISLEISHPFLATLLSVYTPYVGYSEYIVSCYETSTSHLTETFIQHPNLFTEKNVAHIIRQLIDVLKYLSPWGVRALKGPSNLFADVIDNEVHIKLVGYLSHLYFHYHSYSDLLVEGASPEVLSGTCNSIEPHNIWCLGTDPVKREESYVTLPEAFEKILSGNFDFGKGVFPDVADEVIDLIQKCLKPTPEDRITMEQVLAHPWINNKRDIVLPSQLQKIKKRYDVFS